MPRMTATALAQYRALADYKPRISDFVIWSGWWRVWYGVVAGINSDNLHITFEGLPQLLLTQTPTEQAANIKLVTVSQILSARAGTFAVLQHDTKHNVPIWYI